MSRDQLDCLAIYNELRRISAVVLSKYGCTVAPYVEGSFGPTRTRKWRPHNGRDRFRGMLFHYTGGVSMVGAMRWGNHPGWGNRGSSWHVQVADRVAENAMGEIWSKIDDEIRRLFPVPTIVMSDLRTGTWHGNWTNDVTIGVENRNGGYWGYGKADGGLKGLGKEGIRLNGRTWEEYTREQIVCNVNLGRLCNGLIHKEMDADWILTHQCVNTAKSDTGPVFPIHDVRSAILSDEPVESLPWLVRHPMAPDTNEDDDEHWDELGDYRVESINEFVQWVTPSPVTIKAERDPEWIASHLYRIGFNTPPGTEQRTLRKQVRWFQRGTGSYKARHPDWILKPDGICGPKTSAILKQRLKQLRLS